jgi:hypothetical protein
MLKYDKPRRARILARTIASDMVLYNRELIEEAIKNDNLFEALQDQIEEGRAHYKSRVTPEIFEGYNLYERALVDKLLVSMGYVESEIW